jgi:tetratricopeptide (TPR) repeat protein
MSNGAIAVATSIPPSLPRRNADRAIDGAYQKLCVRSWLDCGFRVLSVNHPDEIPDLATAYPEVSFIATHRDASAVSGRRTPYIADLLSALLEAPEVVTGIINSDLVFEPSAVWQTWLPSAVGGAVVTGQRHDATSLLDGTFRKYYWGFDFFFFDIKAARDLLETAAPFAMGLPWWDYWLPAALSLKGRQVLTLERPTVAHLIHKEPSLDDGWRQLAMSFAAFVAEGAAKCGGPLPPGVSAVLSLCRDLTHIPELRWRNRGADAEISQIAVQYIPAITRNIANTPSDEGQTAATSPNEMVPANVFRRFAERLSAGEALERAKQMERSGNSAEARANFQYALARTPRDFDLLLAFGEFRLRQGDCSGAAGLLRKAIENDSDHRATYGNLAIALYQSASRAEAIKLLEDALVKWPDFAEARDLLARFS